MWIKLLHLLTMVSFLNMLTFDKSRHMELLFGQDEIVTDTLVEFILDDIMDVDSCPKNDADDPDIVYEDYRGIASVLTLVSPIVYYFVASLFPKVDIYEFQDHPNYVSKMSCEPGYYTFLYRLRLF